MFKSATVAAFACLLLNVSDSIAETGRTIDIPIKGSKTIKLKPDCPERTFCIPGQPCDRSCKNMKVTLQTTPSGIDLIIEGIDEGNLSITLPEK